LEDYRIDIIGCQLQKWILKTGGRLSQYRVAAVQEKPENAYKDKTVSHYGEEGGCAKDIKKG
jgi:hypothetical protein